MFDKPKVLIVDGDPGFREKIKGLLDDCVDVVGDSPDPTEHPDAPPKLNLNGKRMAVQPRDDSQNYLQLRNKRW